MSVVAVRVMDSEIVIGSDSIRVRGYTQAKQEGGKLFQSDLGVVVGSCGMSETAALFRLFLASHQPKASTEDGITDFIAEFHSWFKKKTEDASRNIDNNDFIIVFRGKAFHVHGYFVREITDYYAIGAGNDFALAALYMGASVEKAIETACELSIYCELPLNLITQARAV